MNKANQNSSASKPAFSGEVLGRARIGDLGKIQSGGTPSSKHPEYFAGNIPWIGTTALNGGLLDDKDAVKLITKEAVSQSATKLVPAGSIMVGTRVGVGKVGINLVPMCTSQDVVSIVDINEHIWNKEYISLALQYAAPRLAAQAQGATITGITSRILKDVTIPVRKATDQAAVVAKLNLLKGLTHSVEIYLTDLQTLVKSRFIEMFGDPGTSNPQWAKAPLGVECKIITGNTPSRKCLENYGDFLEWVKTDNINSAGSINPSSESLSVKGAEKARIVDAGTILMTCIAGSVKSIGRVGLTDRRIAFNQQINAIVPGPNYLPEYLLWAFKLSKDYLCRDINMQLKGILNKTALSAKEYAIPPLPLQREFAGFAERAAKLEFVAQRQIEKLQMLYDSLAQEYFG